MLRLLLASEDGYLYVYSLDVNEGGDCALIRQFHLSNKDDPPTTSSPEAVKLEQQQLEATSEVDGGGSRKPGLPPSPTMMQDKLPSESKKKKKEKLQLCFCIVLFFLVDISYADRLRNRLPSDMTGNFPPLFNLEA